MRKSSGPFLLGFMLFCSIFNMDKKAFHKGENMKTWTISQARASMADVFDAALQQGPQRIERSDTEAVLIISESDWNRLATEYADFGDFLLNAPISPEYLPARKPARVIDPDFA